MWGKQGPMHVGRSGYYYNDDPDREISGGLLPANSCFALHLYIMGSIVATFKR